MVCQFRPHERFGKVGAQLHSREKDVFQSLYESQTKQCLFQRKKDQVQAWPAKSTVIRDPCTLTCPKPIILPVLLTLSFKTTTAQLSRLDIQFCFHFVYYSAACLGGPLIGGVGNNELWKCQSDIWPKCAQKQYINTCERKKG